MLPSRLFPGLLGTDYRCSMRAGAGFTQLLRPKKTEATSSFPQRCLEPAKAIIMRQRSRTLEQSGPEKRCCPRDGVPAGCDVFSRQQKKSGMELQLLPLQTAAERPASGRLVPRLLLLEALTSREPEQERETESKPIYQGTDQPTNPPLVY